MKELAIVIPAYRSKYLDDVFKSFSDQTCKEFRIYVGDDNSPDDIYSIVEKWKDKINIEYTRFDHNIGASNLVAQWNRCFDLVKDESWIWLFSDDDFVDSNCVSSFYSSLISNPLFDIFHFDTVIVDEHGDRFRKASQYPRIISGSDYLDLTFRWKDRTNGISFIVRREKFYSHGCFQYFDLAWGSDNATWLKLSNPNGIYTIPGAYTYWRYGGGSISSTWSKNIARRKKEAFLDSLEWRIGFCRENFNSIGRSTQLTRAIFIARNIRSYKGLSYASRLEFFRRGLGIAGCAIIYWWLSKAFILPFFEIYNFIQDFGRRK